MRFEYDRDKDEANQEKHGISFAEAQEIWHDPDLMVLHAHKRGEKRLMAIGRTFAVVFPVIHTRRGQAIRIISARKSTRKEAQAYEQHKHTKR